MPRIYLYTTEEELLLMKDKAKKLNMSVSGYAKYMSDIFSKNELETIIQEAARMSVSPGEYIRYMVRLNIEERKDNDILALTKKMEEHLENFEIDKPFIVSTLLKEEWPSLNGSIKRKLGQYLADYIKSRPKQYVKCGNINNISQYKRISKEI